MQAEFRDSSVICFTRTHGCLKALEANLILEGNRQTMEGAHRLSVFFKIPITFFRTSERTFDKNFCQAVGLSTYSFNAETK